MLLADTSQSSFNTPISSPSQMHLQQCSTQFNVQPSSNAITSGFNNLNSLGYSSHDAKVARFRRLSPKLPYYSSMPDPNSSLQPNNLLGLSQPTNLPQPPSSRFGLVTNRMRPLFRKCQSQPSRSLSPGSIRSYSPLIFDPLNPAANQYTLNRMYNRNEMNPQFTGVPPPLAPLASSRTNSPLKRQLPQPPNLNSNLNMNLNVTNNYNLHPASFDNSMMDNLSAYQSTRFSDPTQMTNSTMNAFPTTIGHSSALSNYEINHLKQFSKSSILLPYNRSLDGVRSPQQYMYSDSELNRQYHPTSFDYSTQQQSIHPFRSNQPLFYHHYHRDGDYTTLTRQEMEDEMNRNMHRHTKSKKKQQPYYSDAKDAREEQKFLKEQQKTQSHKHSQIENYDNNEQQQGLHSSLHAGGIVKKRSLRKSSIDEIGEEYSKSYDQYDEKAYDADRSKLQPTDENLTKTRKLSGHHLDDEDQIGVIKSVDQFDKQMADFGVMNDEEIMEQNEMINRNGHSGVKNRSRMRNNKAYSGVLNESGGEESESSSLSKSTASDNKKTGSRTVG